MRAIPPGTGARLVRTRIQVSNFTRAREGGRDRAEGRGVVSDAACQHDKWEVNVLGTEESLRWRSAYPPPPPGTRLALAEGDLPDGVRSGRTGWIVVEVTWFVALCMQCDSTLVTPEVIIAPTPDNGGPRG